MKPLTPHFEFTDSPPAGARVVDIPAGITRKRALLGIVARELYFPGYFGWNWDALEECLRDLHWLPAGESIVLRHRDLPFANDAALRRVWLDIVSSAVDFQECDGSRRLVARFPESARAETLAAWEDIRRESLRTEDDARP